MVIELPNGGVHHDDAALGGFFDIDIVNANTGPANHFEIVGSSNHLFGCLGCRPDRQTVILPDHFEQFLLVLAKIGHVVDLHALVLEDLNSGGRQFVGNKNFCHGTILMFLRCTTGPPVAPANRKIREMGWGVLLERRFFSCEGPIEPSGQRLKIRSLDGGPGPDPKTGRRIAIGSDIESHAFCIKSTNKRLGELGLSLIIKSRNIGIHNFQADRGI